MTTEVPLDRDGELGAPSLVELAVARIRADILRGALTPGERLVEEQLTRRFGVSRAPVREALRLLGQQGLVEHSPRRGVRVVELSARDVQELFDLRDALERFSVDAAFADGRRPTAAALRTLEEAAVRIEDAARRSEHDDPEQAEVDRAEAHRAFHLAFVALADHRHLLRLYEPVLLQLQVCMATNLRREDRHRSPDEGARRHRALHDAVAAGDASAVLDVLAGHGARRYLGPELDDTPDTAPDTERAATGRSGT